MYFQNNDGRVFPSIMKNGVVWSPLESSGACCVPEVSKSFSLPDRAALPLPYFPKKERQRKWLLLEKA